MNQPVIEARSTETQEGVVKKERRVIPIRSVSDNVAEVDRVMRICNACRYCEGFCAVFPAMTRRLEFNHADAHYLANLCHNCGACLHACQYAPPHEFAVNVPKTLAKVRLETYTEYAWPAAFGRLYKNNGVTVALATSVATIVFLLLAIAMNGSWWTEERAGNFYSVFPHNMMALMFGSVFMFSVLALLIGVRRFWRDGSSPVLPVSEQGSAAKEAADAVLRMKYLDGGHGQGCNNEDDAFTLQRRRFHHFTFYGFMLCFAATCVATLYHYLLGLEAPYAYTSLPVLLGTAGGILMLIGPAGLFWLNMRRNKEQMDENQKPMDRGFIALLFLISLTGLVLMLIRETAAMGILLAIHLGFVMGLFLTLPYGKFAHGIYRSAALFKFALEKRKPGTFIE